MPETAPSIYTRVRWWFQPYYQPRPPKPPEEKPAASTGSTTAEPSKPETGRARKPTVEIPADAPVSAVEDDSEQIEDTTVEEQSAPSIEETEEGDIPGVPRGVTYMPDSDGLRIRNMAEPLGDVWEDDVMPVPQEAWFYHDADVHELFSHLVPGSGQTTKKRNDKARRKLQSLIKPLYDDVPVDRTHLMPFGYHANESDSRLLIYWDRQQNRTVMRQFEDRQKKRTTAIYWLARVTHTSNEAQLRYAVWDAATLELLDDETFTMHDVVLDWAEDYEQDW